MYCTYINSIIYSYCFMDHINSMPYKDVVVYSRVETVGTVPSLFLYMITHFFLDTPTVRPLLPVVLVC